MTDYYVDATSGDDTANGTTTGTPWKTIAKVNTATLNPNDNVYFKRGEVWREALIPQSGTSDGVVTYSAYGTGSKPMLKGSVNRSSTDYWTHEGGNIWYSSEAAAGAEKLTNPSFTTNLDGWFGFGADDYTASRTTTGGEYDSAPAGYKFTRDAEGSGGIEIYTNSSQNQSITLGKWYVLTFRAKATAEFVTGGVSLFKTTSPYTEYFSLRSQYKPTITTSFTTHTVYFLANVTAADARIDFRFDDLANGETLFLDTLSFKEMAEKPTYKDVGNLCCDDKTVFGVKVWNKVDLTEQGEYWYNLLTKTVYVYSVSNPGTFYSEIECAITEQIITEDNIDYVTYENLHIDLGAGHGIGGGSVSYITIQDCDVSYIGGGDQYQDGRTTRYGNGIEFWNAHNNCIVQRNYVYECYDGGHSSEGNSTSDYSVFNVYVRNNIFYRNYHQMTFWCNGVGASLSEAVYFENNTCIEAGYEWSNAQRPDQDWDYNLSITNDVPITNGIYFRNNIFKDCKNYNLVVHRWDSTIINEEKIFLDNNCFYRTGTTAAEDGVATDVTYEVGEVGNCARFNGSSSKVIATKVDDIDKDKPFSISLWFKSDGAQTVDGGQLLANFHTSSNLFGISVADNGLAVSCGVYDGASYFSKKSGVIEADTWYHLAYTFDGENTSVLKLNNATQSGTNNPSVNFTATLSIGAGGSGANRFFDGVIDDVRIYSHVLTDVEITTLYGKGDVTPTIRHYLLESDATDSSDISVKETRQIQWLPGTYYDVAHYKSITGQDANSFETDPKIVDDANENYMIEQNSPCKNAGVATTKVTEDYKQISRPQKGKYDIGAYELIGGASGFYSMNF